MIFDKINKKSKDLEKELTEEALINIFKTKIEILLSGSFPEDMKKKILDEGYIQNLAKDYFNIRKRPYFNENLGFEIIESISFAYINGYLAGINSRLK